MVIQNIFLLVEELYRIPCLFKVYAGASFTCTWSQELHLYMYVQLIDCAWKCRKCVILHVHPCYRIVANFSHNQNTDTTYQHKIQPMVTFINAQEMSVHLLCYRNCVKVTLLYSWKTLFHMFPHSSANYI